MKYLSTLKLLAVGFVVMLVAACSDDDTPMPMPTGMEDSFALNALNNSGVSGSIKIEEADLGGTIITVNLNGTSSGNMHPAHIHFNTAAEGGDIAVSLTPIDGATGMSETYVETLDDGTAITYSELMQFDGYVNVHLSADELATVVAQGDIGVNELTGESKSYALNEKDVDGISGTFILQRRANGTALATVMLSGTQAGGSHPGHIHDNTAAEGGGIAVSLNPVDGATGMSKTSIEMKDDGSAITYDQLLSYDGYVNIHASASDLATLAAQGDIGQNELTGESKSYELGTKAVAGISGTFTLSKRVNGEALAVVMLNGTSSGGMHPGHIHNNAAIEGGGIAYTFNEVDGESGMSVNNIAALDDGTMITYDELLDFNGYINIHASADDLATLVAQGDIGSNEMTGESYSYDLSTKDVVGVDGTVTFNERKDGSTLATIELNGTTAGTLPGHIHDNAAVEGGGIAVTFTPVDGITGMSMTNIRMKDDGTAITYDELLDFNGYVNIHASANDLATLAAQGDIGANELTGMTVSYDLNEVDQAGTSGMITFMERKDGTTLIKIELQNTLATDSHPGHIHENTAAQGGGILFTFNNVDGATGLSMTNMRALDDGTAISYSDVATFNGYVNIHKSVNDLATLVAQGNIGANAN
ncbi:MAG: CHRD domain-containing protein [Cytophagia bacterium]|nr:CHRD domain-containing protein [Cytophagia bacterium]